jgi:DoxX-like family
MATAEELAGSSKGMVWAGRILSGLIVAFMAYGAAIGLTKPDMVQQGFEHMGYPYSLHTVFAILMIGSTLIYAIPQTSVLGAILLTGYFGGAVATHLRIGEPPYIPIVIGVLAWLAIYLRDARLRALVPLRS